MTVPIRFLVGVVACTLATLLALGDRAQPSADPRCGVFEMYDRILPAKISDDEDMNAREVLLVRYIPSDTSLRSEFVVTLRVDKSGLITAKWTEPIGASLLAQVRAIENAGTLKCDDVLKAVQLRSTVVNNQRVLRRLLAEVRAMKVPGSLESAYYLDASRYEIIHHATMNSATFVLYGPSLQSRRPHPLILWVQRLEQSLRPLVGSQGSKHSEPPVH